MDESVALSRPAPQDKSQPLDPYRGINAAACLPKDAQNIDWAATAFGPQSSWSMELCLAMSICMQNPFAQACYWGKDLVMFYNEKYRAFLGPNKSWAMGRTGPEIWAEIWHMVGPQIMDVYENGAVYYEVQPKGDLAFKINRHGYFEEACFIYALAPLYLGNGSIGGVWGTVMEITDSVVGQRRLKTLSDLIANLSNSNTILEACATATSTLCKRRDVPFALLYLKNEKGNCADLVAHTGDGDTVPSYAVSAPTTLSLRTNNSKDAAQEWPIAEVFETSELREFGLQFATEDASHAVALPIIAPRGSNTVSAVIVLGIYSARPFDEAYREWFGLIVSHLVGAFTNAFAREEERKARMLAELDKAKTVFFSNVSHEFRTPLTLMLGPIEHAMTDTSLPADHIEKLNMVFRNGQRLMKLVNTLLDFSRLEAGRHVATFIETDVGALTSELASAFQSSAYQLDTKLVIDCPSLGEDCGIFVDRDMWEKIVLNLISNAFKYTWKGQVTVKISRAGNAAVAFSVTDTGIGIAPEDTNRIFDRFFRVESVQGRSKEGTGIGLALVKDLVRLHGGSVNVTSKVGEGSTFTVMIPSGRSHLPEERTRTASDLQQEELMTPSVSLISDNRSQYSAETANWLKSTTPPRPSSNSSSSLESADEPSPTAIISADSSARDSPKRQRRALPSVLLAEDNLDMQRYIASLLAPYFDVRMVGNGEEALAELQSHLPDVILTDCVMPVMDGLQLLRNLRSNYATMSIPVIMLSARAGPDASIDGIEAGADDYLSKPFTARELIARVRTTVNLARGRIKLARREHRMALHKQILLSVTEKIRAGLFAPQLHMQTLDAITRELQTTLHADIVTICRFSREGRRRLSGSDERTDLTLSATHSLPSSEPSTPREDHLVSIVSSARKLSAGSESDTTDYPSVSTMGRPISLDGDPTHILVQVRQRLAQKSHSLIRPMKNQESPDESTTSETDGDSSSGSDSDFFETLVLQNAANQIGSLLPKEICGNRERGDNCIFALILVRNQVWGIISCLLRPRQRAEMIREIKHGHSPLIMSRKHKWSHSAQSLLAQIAAQIGLGETQYILKEEQQQQQRVIEAVQAASKAKSMIVANTSHEIRTPLNAIIGMMEMLQDTPLNIEQQEMVQTVARSSELLLGIVNDILDFSKLEANKMRFHYTDFNLQDLLEATMDMFAEIAGNKGVELVNIINLPDSFPHTVRTDSARLQQVLINLVNNAIKFTLQGEVVVTVSCEGSLEEMLARKDVHLFSSSSSEEGTDSDDNKDEDENEENTEEVYATALTSPARRSSVARLVRGRMGRRRSKGSTNYSAETLPQLSAPRKITALQDPSLEKPFFLRVTVRDTGIGMTKEGLARIFRSFTQVDESMTRSFGGTGLGLAISKHLVEYSGGEIGVKSRAGRGSSFWFTWPCGQASDFLNVSPPKPSIPIGIPSHATATNSPRRSSFVPDQRALVIDHSQSSVTSISIALRGIVELQSFTKLETGLSAFQEAAKTEEPFTVVLLDVSFAAGVPQSPASSEESYIHSTQLSPLQSQQQLRLPQQHEFSEEAILKAAHEMAALAPNTLFILLSPPSAGRRMAAQRLATQICQDRDPGTCMVLPKPVKRDRLRRCIRSTLAQTTLPALLEASDNELTGGPNQTGSSVSPLTDTNVAAAAMEKAQQIPMRGPERKSSLSRMNKPATATTSELTSGQSTRKKVLVVEDNRVNQRVVMAQLAKLGYEADTANHGGEAISKIESCDYGVVLMDVAMPVMDGFEATRHVRQLPDERFRSLPIIALTASVMEGDRMRSKDSGMNDFLSKPLRTNQLAAALQKWYPIPSTTTTATTTATTTTATTTALTTSVEKHRE